MAFIGSLRNKMGTWVVVFVFVAIAAFTLGDIFSGNSSILNWGKNSVGEIAGKEISYDEFQSVLQERENNYILNFGREPGDREKTGLRQQAWDLLIARHAIESQYEKVGVEVNDDEVVDMISGKNIDPGVMQAFTNQETGQFDRAALGNYINQIKAMPLTSEQRIRWELFQKDLQPGRARIKYENLLIKTNYVTSAEAEREYHLQSDVAEVRYVYVPFYAVSDSSAKVTDKELQEYYNKNKEKFKTDETRDLKYVSIPLVPSADDSLVVFEDLQKAVAEFKTESEDSIYAATNTDGRDAFVKYTVATLPAFVNQDSLVQGKVFGPFLDGENYKVVKVSSIIKDTVLTARAKHILIRWADTSESAKKEAKTKAQDILKDLKGGADFAAKAREFGTDGTASRGGDVGWFTSIDQMAQPFKDAVFAAPKVGLLNEVVETEFGYHIIEVTNAKNNDAYKLAVVERTITPSDATTNEAFRKAEAFASNLTDLASFEASAKQSGLIVMDALNVGAADRSIGTLTDARQIVQWLFRDASTGKISQVYDLQDQNVVAIMTNKIEKGYKPLNVVKTEITPAVRNIIKGKIIIEKLESSKGTLDEAAKLFGELANVYSTSDLKLNSNSMPTVGFDPQAVGLAFSLESGKRSKPVAGENGVVLLELQNKTVAPSIENYSAYKDQLIQNAASSSAFNITEAIKTNSDIVDMRYKFF
ncbi:MAG TPA: SurA N-terminal domain-containing protein [Chryseolinea sp.]|nr:SurA N-terminal domain-containing protein [Chryseolinea sp.]HPH45380.1 SurA N-terminal domain-containing protein [Chryseolinea sp.]HPM29348.1 SurA N-terminal domain-containing protein [Chryseolinea sp.]